MAPSRFASTRRSLAHIVSSQVRDLKRLLTERFPTATPLAERDALRLARPVATGIVALDLVLPGGGLPRGKLTAWTPTGGAAAVLRAACRAALARGERAAWVDAAHAVSLGWAREGNEWTEGAPLVVRPNGRTSALRSAELLLRSGAFALVVLEAAPGDEPQGTETVRLARATRDGGGAGVVLTESASMAALRVRSSLDVRNVTWRRGPFGDPAEPVEVIVDVRARASGWNAHARLKLPVTSYDLRCALEPGPDRRGVKGR
jgi:hypothetical protein